MSTAVATRTEYTPEYLLAMPDGKSYELVDGQLVERNMGAESSWVGGELHARLRHYGQEHQLGWAFPADTGYQCFAHAPGLVRKPDVSFVRYGRLPGGRLPQGWIKIRPDLAVEVVSPNDTVEKLNEKLEDYEIAGIPLVWVIDPGTRSVMIYRGDSSIHRAHEADELSGEDIIPGFRCPVREILPRREAVPDGPQQPEWGERARSAQCLMRLTQSSRNRSTRVGTCPMILCITLNPCLDKTLTVPTWRPGDLVRGVAIREVVGGKGNNVSRGLLRLGRDPVPITFLGGPAGASCESLLRTDDGLEPISVPTAAPTRVILTVRTEVTDDQTAFFDPDPAITPAEADAMIQRIEESLRGNVAAMTLSGSSPSPATHGLFSEFIAMARARSVPVFLDTYGPALDAIRGFWPTAIQLNRREAAAHLRKPALSDADASDLLQEWTRHGVACGIITDGPNPVAIQFRGKRYRAIPPPIQAVNPIGSGDSFMAGLVDGWLKRLDPEPLLRHALACAVANALVWDAGAIDPAEVERWSERIQVEALPK